MFLYWQQFFYTYLNWFGASEVLGAEQAMNVHTMSHVIGAEYIPQPEAAEEGSTVVFDSYPPKGWLGYCNAPDCAGQTPYGIVTGWEYSVTYYYFVYYATSDAYADGATGSAYEDLSAEVKAWLESFFVWLVPVEPPPPSTDGVAGILSGIGAASAPLTVTLLWNAPVDLDLYLYCPDGSEVGYNSGVGVLNPACDAKLDHDMVADGYNVARGDGSLGQVENISVGLEADEETGQARTAPADGTTFVGDVHYYGGSGPADFQVVFSGTDAEGTLHVFGQEFVEGFSNGYHEFSVTYTA